MTQLRGLAIDKAGYTDVDSVSNQLSKIQVSKRSADL